jgi:dUTP pyrophosphatase
MKVKIKKLVENAVAPIYATEGAAGMDLTATSVHEDEYGNMVYGTGLAFEIPKGYVGLLFPRSSNSKKDLILTNCVGVLDSDYRGEVFFKFRPMYHNVKNNIVSRIVSFFTGKNTVTIFNFEEYEVGDRIGQIVIVKIPTIEFVESEKLSETERGKGGYGSTGK